VTEPDRLRCIVELESGPCRGNPVAVEGDGQARCLSHALDPVRIRRREEGNNAGGRARLRTLPGGTKAPSFQSRQRVVRFLEELARQVLTGEVDPRLSAEARGCAAVAMTAHELDALERLNALEKRIGGRRIA
jgi:hypothetical protein